MPIPGLLVDTTRLMRRRCGTPVATQTPAGEVVEIDDLDALLADCASIGRQTSPERCRLRRRRGLRFFSFRHDGASVANTWLVRGGERFLDEAMLAFELGPDEACLRDMFVRPAARGRGAFASFVLALERGPLAGAASLWSCVEDGNAASIAAHRRAGFESHGKVGAMVLFGHLMLRRGAPPDELPCRAFEPGRRLLWIGARARAFREQHLA